MRTPPKYGRIAPTASLVARIANWMAADRVSFRWRRLTHHSAVSTAPNRATPAAARFPSSLCSCSTQPCSSSISTTDPPTHRYTDSPSPRRRKRDWSATAAAPAELGVPFALPFAPPGWQCGHFAADPCPGSAIRATFWLEGLPGLVPSPRAQQIRFTAHCSDRPTDPPTHRPIRRVGSSAGFPFPRGFD